VLKEQQPCNYSTLIAALQARSWEAPKRRMANSSRDVVCLLTHGHTLVTRTLTSNQTMLAFVTKCMIGWVLHLLLLLQSQYVADIHTITHLCY
jgi:hypothetical protein